MVGKKRPPSERGRRGTTRSLYVYTHQSENLEEGGGRRSSREQGGTNACCLFGHYCTKMNCYCLTTYIIYSTLHTISNDPVCILIQQFCSPLPRALQHSLCTLLCSNQNYHLIESKWANLIEMNHSNTTYKFDDLVSSLYDSPEHDLDRSGTVRCTDRIGW